MAGNLTIINATPFEWQRTSLHGDQMVQWDFPLNIAPGQMITVASEWDDFGDSAMDPADAGYTFTTTSGEDIGFQFQAHFKDTPFLSVVLDSASTFGNPPGSTIDLGFNDDGETPFIFSGNQKASFESTNPPEDWMHQNLESIGCLPIRRICMPASHNSGMSLFNGKTGLATPENTLAHYADIAGQLSAGFRFFDIRPVISDGQFYTGHYSNALEGSDFLDNFLDVWQGGNGQRMDKIISQVNDFLDKHKELVIINLSHSLDTDNKYESFTQEEQNRLFKQLLGLRHRYIAPKGVTDLSTMALKDILADGPAVIIILDNKQAGEHMNADAFKDQGFYTNAQFSVFNQYANTDQVGKMSNDQIGKMKKQRTGPNSDMFLLSWTLTTILNIRLFAHLAHDALFRDLWPAMTKDSYPNFIMIDAIGAEKSPINPRNVAAMSIAIAQTFNEDCRG